MPADEQLKEFLGQMKGGLPGLYLLGSFNRHITVHSQQRRAINLIHSLIRVGGGLDEKSLAIVGAGFAGLTAAAYALEKSTAKVVLFDAAPRPLWLQDGCANRWLHPGIYDWPLPGSLEPRTRLPVLNWHAGSAAEVAQQVRAEWERIAARKRGLAPRFETVVGAVTAGAADKLVVELSNGQAEPFDIVVLAVGFGLEAGRPGRVGYWNDADGLDGIAAGFSVLVSGFGDGGLADVLRLCLPDFRQDSLVELVRHVPEATRQQLIDWDNNHHNEIAVLDQHYTRLQVKPVVEQLKNSQPALARVTLAGKGHLYSQRSAILNRFLISQLRQARGEGAFEIVEGAVDDESLTPAPEGRLRIALGEPRQEREFDNVVLRLGPEPAYRRIRPVSDWPNGDLLRMLWYKLPQSLDKTRLPLWEDAPDPRAGLEPRQDFLACESSSRRWCLVLHPPKAQIDWSVRAGLALKRLYEDKDEEKGKEPDKYGLNPRPLLLCSEEALAGEAEVGDAVRALCAADIVIADVTGYDPGVLLLLGIRAAVRRGVTITCTKQADVPALWKSVPFNLKELKLVSQSHTKHGLEQLVAALRSGLSQLVNSDRYLDLPVYDYVRANDPDGETLESARVLVLRAFKDGDEDRPLFLDNRIGSALRQRLGLKKAPRVEAVIDQASPRLAGQRLYEAIRHWHTCVVDLTWWRANVLFELGVRLAVRSERTYCIIDESAEGDKTFAGSRGVLRKLLQPFSYDLQTDSFAEAFAASTRPWFYAAVVHHFRTGQDRLGLEEFLEGTAPLKPGDDLLQDVDIRQLYASDNRDYWDELKQSSLEMRCAAWYYLAEREQPHLTRPLDLLDPRREEIFDRFQKLGARLTTELAHRPEQRDVRLRERIDECMEVATESGTIELAGRLDDWRRLRERPLWQTDPAKVEPDQWADLVAEGEEQCQQLTQLADRLKDLASPICELPVQAVRSDLRRLEIALQDFRRRIP